MKKFLIIMAPFYILLFLCMWFLCGLKGALEFFGIILFVVALVFGAFRWADFVDKHIKD